MKAYWRLFYKLIYVRSSEEKASFSLHVVSISYFHGSFHLVVLLSRCAMYVVFEYELINYLTIYDIIFFINWLCNLLLFLYVCRKLATNMIVCLTTYVLVLTYMILTFYLATDCPCSFQCHLILITLVPFFQPQAVFA